MGAYTVHSSDTESLGPNDEVQVAKVLVDAANPSVIKELKNRIGGDTEYLNYEV